MAKRKGSLLRQLTVSLGLAIIFLSLASFYYQYQVERHILMASIRDDLAHQANLLRAWLGPAQTDEDRAAIARQYVETLEHLGGDRRTIIIVDADSRVVTSNAEQEPGQVYRPAPLAEAMAAGAPPEGVSLEFAGESVIALPCYASPARKVVKGGILLRQPLTAVEKLAASLMLGAFILLAVTLAIIVVVVHVVLRLKVHRPIQAIFMQEYRIREGDLAKIEAADPQNEFSDLYAMYNEMVTRIAEQKKAIFEQKDHVALARLVRQAIARLTGPLDEILTEARALLEHESSLSDDDRKTLRQIIGNITRIARELKSMVEEGDKSATWLKHEAEKLRQYEQSTPDQTDEHGRHVIE